MFCFVGKKSEVRVYNDFLTFKSGCFFSEFWILFIEIIQPMAGKEMNVTRNKLFLVKQAQYRKDSTSQN